MFPSPAFPYLASSLCGLSLGRTRGQHQTTRRTPTDSPASASRGETGTYELVAGTRRYRASKLAKRESIPATVRELTDAQALELQVIENVQRVDVHPLDEAQGYAALIEIQPDTYTVESIASRVGRSPAYVSGRLRLIQLIPETKQAFYEDKLTVAHAFEIARLQPLCNAATYGEIMACHCQGPRLSGEQHNIIERVVFEELLT